MKKQIQSLLLVAIFACTALSAWGQASTEGREFWVALNMTTGTGGTDHEPFICITTQHQGGFYTITKPSDPNFTPITGPIPNNGYIKILSKQSPGTGEINLNDWYPVGQTALTMSNQVANKGLKITTTVDCSVFVGNRLPQSFDAANILPITAIQTDYITQDYPGYDHENKGGGYPVTTILATENNTTVNFIPSSAVLTNSGALSTTATITKTLQEGQVLYLTGDNRASLSGSIISSNKKIAVFTGVNNTDVPGPVSARDHLYEQNMPVDYWGTHFVVTRSMKKDANRIRVTASNNGTELKVDGTYMATINTGETYEFELCSDAMRTQDGYTKADGEGRGTEFYFTGEAHYLETSCPCAVFSYDVSENYYIKKDGTSERDANSAGDPSMVWISPLEQQLRKVTFGVMNTDQTPTHYVNIITPATDTSSIAVREIVVNAGQVKYSNNLIQPTDIKPVPGKPTYSYVRVKLVEDAESVYTITSDVGFIAHVYGSGTKESYAYSCGSAAVQQGVNVNNETFTDGYISDTRFCVNNELLFDAAIGTDEITRVDWDFGDGISEYNSTPQISHTYTIPGWYDVEAELYGTQVCKNISDQSLGKIHFSFRVVRHDTIPVNPTKKCLKIAQWKAIISQYGQDSLNTLLRQGERTILNPDAPCYEDRQISLVTYGLETDSTYSITANDSAYIHDRWYYPETLPADGKIQWTLDDANQYGCDSFVTCNARILTCLVMDIPNVGGTICPGDKYDLSYTRRKGEIGEVRFLCGSTNVQVQAFTNPDIISLPTAQLQPGVHQATITVRDEICDQTLRFPVSLTVNYPKDIFKQKFDNVLAVYNKGFGGNTGYDFVEPYQWFLNGMPIEGATQSVYHHPEAFKAGDEIYVVLTRADGVVLPSCPQTVETKPYMETLQQAPATKQLVNRQIVIKKEDKAYNIYGQRIQ